MSVHTDVSNSSSDDNVTKNEKTATPSKPRITWSDSYTKAQKAIESLSTILPYVPPNLTASDTPACSLLHDEEVASQISRLLRQPDSGAGDDELCRWLFDTFQSSESDLHLIVLRYLPIIAGVYLSRVNQHKPLAGLEVVLLAFYTYETTVRNGQPISVSVPDLSHTSIYHETKLTSKNSSVELNIAVLSPSLEPHTAVRSTRRARIIGVGLELYFSKISKLPIRSKIEFCEFCEIWAGEDGDIYRDSQESSGDGGEDMIEEEESSSTSKRRWKEGRTVLPWELLQPILRILGHCLMGPNTDNELYEAASGACRALYARSLHDLNPKAILATGSLLKLVKIASDSDDDGFDPTDIQQTNLISL